MRVLLAFPPPASATYVPIGIASVAAFLRRELPDAEVQLLDLNVAAWERLIGASPDGPSLVSFWRGKQGRFFDRGEYAAFQRRWHELAREMASLGDQACRFAGREVDTPEPALQSLLDEQVQLIVGSDPDVLGLSLLYPEQVGFAVALARRLRQLAGPSLRVIAGGAALTALQFTDLLRLCPELEVLLLGEGEPGIRDWLAGSRPDEIAGLVYRDQEGRVHTTRRRAAPVLDELPPPDYSGLCLDRYFNPVPVLPALYSRGCAWRRCRFCAHNASLGRHRRKRVSKFVDELAALQTTLGVRHIYLADQNVEAPALDELAREILSRGLRIAFHAMARPTPDFTEELLGRAAAAGCRWISWGVESGSQHLLDLCRKGTGAETVPAVIRAAHAVGISNLAMLVFGLPGSGDEDLAQTLQLLETCFPYLDAVTASSFVLFDNTPFGRRPRDHGLLALDQQHLFGEGDRAVRSLRRRHRELDRDGGSRPPRGSLEIAAWQQRRRWLGELAFDHLGVEHYLLYADQRHHGA